MGEETVSGVAHIRRWVSGPDVPRTYLWSRWVFLRLLGAVFLVAFGSLWVQLDGLISSVGILPATEVSEWAAHEGKSWLEFPMLFRGELSDETLRATVLTGLGASLLLLLGIVPRLAIAVAWTIYLSFLYAGRSFFSYQWDTLLLETALVAFFLAPGSLLSRPSRLRPPPTAALLASRVLLFKLMFLSGFVKLGDVEWDELTALQYHYWTQPLPTWVGWYAHQLPVWFHEASVVLTLAIELFVPFLIFGPRRARLFAAGAFVFLMVVIGLTGNYNFFNLLTVALCVLLVDDATLLRFVPRRSRERLLAVDIRPRLPVWFRVHEGAAVLALSIASLGIVASRVWPERELVPRWVQRIQESGRPFVACNSYGLFANMTTVRYEIELEGSENLFDWQPYRLPWKPGPTDRAPGFCQPHQPRLDWEMWFAALGTRQPMPWTAREVLPRLCQRLLEGEPAVMALFAEVPFDGKPPRFLRATYRSYRFTIAEERRETGDWWKRDRDQGHVPPLRLQNGRMMPAM